MDNNKKYLDQVRSAICSRDFERALEICGEWEDDSAASVDLTRTRAEVYARMRDVRTAALEMRSLLDTDLAEERDFFQAALYFLENDGYEEANQIAMRASEAGFKDSWFSSEWMFIRSLCDIKLGNLDEGIKMAKKLPDDIVMMVKPLYPPLTKKDLLEDHN